MEIKLLTLRVSYRVEALFHPMLGYVFAFLGDSDTNILGWQKKIGCFFFAGCYGKMRTKCFGQPNTMDRQKCLESSCRTDNQFMSFCSILILRQKKPCLGGEKKWKRLKITAEGKYPPFFQSLHCPCNIAIHFALHIPILYTLWETDFYHHFAS